MKEKTEEKQSLLHQLWQLVAITYEDFKNLYIATVDNYLTYLLTHNNVSAESEWIHSIKNSITALKRRRYYLLPIGEACEISFQEQEEWTYAIFLAALLKELVVKNNIEIISLLVPAEGLSWLKRNHNLFNLWQEYLLDNNKNIFSKIIENNASSLEVSSQLKSEPSVSLDYKENFLQWIKTGVLNKTITVNEVTSWVHGVEKGVFIILSPILDGFYKVYNFNQSVKEINQELTQFLENKKYLITNNESIIHHYCLGRWENRKILQGIIISFSAFNNDISIPKSTSITIDPLANT